VFVAAWLVLPVSHQHLIQAQAHWPSLVNILVCILTNPLPLKVADANHTCSRAGSKNMMQQRQQDKEVRPVRALAAALCCCLMWHCSSCLARQAGGFGLKKGGDSCGTTLQKAHESSCDSRNMRPCCADGYAIWRYIDSHPQQLTQAEAPRLTYEAVYCERLCCCCQLLRGEQPPLHFLDGQLVTSSILQQKRGGAKGRGKGERQFSDRTWSFSCECFKAQLQQHW
jgi:hypothetical protein